MLRSALSSISRTGKVSGRKEVYLQKLGKGYREYKEAGLVKHY